jgi:hypothetical protein
MYVRFWPKADTSYCTAHVRFAAAQIKTQLQAPLWPGNSRAETLNAREFLLVLRSNEIGTVLERQFWLRGLFVEIFSGGATAREGGA